MAPTPLTILSPVPWWWALWIRGTWAFARICPLVARPLERLSFIHAARWALLGPWRDRRLLFLTTFDGDDVQYIEAFVRVVPGRILGLYGGARGFPGVRRSRPVERYIRDCAQEVGHFWCAHPEATVTMKRQALRVAELYDGFEDRGVADRERFATAVQGLI